MTLVSLFPLVRQEIPMTFQAGLVPKQAGKQFAGRDERTKSLVGTLRQGSPAWWCPLISSCLLSVISFFFVFCHFFGFIAFFLNLIFRFYLPNFLLGLSLCVPTIVLKAQ